MLQPVTTLPTSIIPGRKAPQQIKKEPKSSIQILCRRRTALTTTPISLLYLTINEEFFSISTISEISFGAMINSRVDKATR